MPAPPRRLKRGARRFGLGSERVGNRRITAGGSREGIGSRWATSGNKVGLSAWRGRPGVAAEGSGVVEAAPRGCPQPSRPQKRRDRGREPRPSPRVGPPRGKSSCSRCGGAAGPRSAQCRRPAWGERPRLRSPPASSRGAAQPAGATCTVWLGGTVAVSTLPRWAHLQSGVENEALPGEARCFCSAGASAPPD